MGEYLSIVPIDTSNTLEYRRFLKRIDEQGEVLRESLDPGHNERRIVFSIDDQGIDFHEGVIEASDPATTYRLTIRRNGHEYEWKTKFPSSLRAAVATYKDLIEDSSQLVHLAAKDPNFMEVARREGGLATLDVFVDLTVANLVIEEIHQKCYVEGENALRHVRF